MKMSWFLFALIIITVSSRPSKFDVRAQPSLTKYADYTLKNQGTCLAHAWGQQLSQIVGNAYSLQMKHKISLSSQHLIECTYSRNQICHEVTLDNIRKALVFIEKSGITTTDCKKNKIFYDPKNCSSTCDDGSQFSYQIKAKFTKHDNINTALDRLIADEVTTGFVVVKVTNSMNFYSSEKSELQIAGDTFQYRVGQIMGWKNQGKDIIVRLGSGEGWGFNGFATLNVDKHSQIIIQQYTVNALPSEGMKIVKQKQLEI